MLRNIDGTETETVHGVPKAITIAIDIHSPPVVLLMQLMHRCTMPRLRGFCCSKVPQNLVLQTRLHRTAKLCVLSHVVCPS